MGEIGKSMGILERGSVILLRSCGGYPNWDEAVEMINQLCETAGHNQLLLMVLRPADQIMLVGPEGMREVIKSMARAELEALAAR